jgi:DNA polymerase V
VCCRHHADPPRLVPSPARLAELARLIGSADARELVAAATRCVEAAWRDGFVCVKAGVILDDLRPADAVPPTLLDSPRRRLEALMWAIDAKHRRCTIHPAAMGTARAPELRTA